MQFHATVQQNGKAACGIQVPDEVVRQTFDGLSYSNRSWHVLQITGAKTDETRQRRIAKSIAALSQGHVR